MALNLDKHDELLSPAITGHEVEEVMRHAREMPDMLNLLATSIAPSLCGLDFAKKALVLQVQKFLILKFDLSNSWILKRFVC